MSYTTQPFINFTMEAAVTDSGQAFSGAPYESEAAKSFTYAWEALSTACAGVTISSPASRSTLMSFNDISTATVLQPLNNHTDPRTLLKRWNCGTTVEVVRVRWRDCPRGGVGADRISQQA